MELPYVRGVKALASSLRLFNTMSSIGVLGFSIVVTGVILLSRLPYPTLSAAATIEFAPGVGADADRPIIQEVVAAFQEADKAVNSGDIDALMKFYAVTYNYHGLKKSDVRRVWQEVFEHYRDISSSHVFTELELTRANGVRKVSVTCTGWLRGTEAATGKPVTIDSWVREVHYLVKEERGWRFLGNKGGTVPSAPPAAAPHHPLF